MRSSETGAALILVLGIVSVMSTMAIFSFDSLTRLISMTTAQAGQAQARQHALAAEQMAIKLTRDAIRRNVSLRQQMQSGQNQFVFSRDGAELSGEISDITNCFNLNALIDGRYASGWQAKPTNIRRFSALLQNFGLGPQAANAISAAAADWQDSDDTPLPDGAETDHYAKSNPPYRPPNAPMASAEELRLIRDVSPKLMRALDGLLCADAAYRHTLINISMLQPRHAPLLQALLGPSTDENQLRSMLTSQPQEGYSLAAFWAHPAIANADVKNATKKLFGTMARRVRVKINVKSDTGRSQMSSDIHFFTNGTYTMISRKFGAL